MTDADAAPSSVGVVVVAAGSGSRLGADLPEAVVHLAALQVPFVRANPPLGMHVNVAGTVNVFDAVL